MQHRLGAQPLTAVRAGLPALVKTTVAAGVTSDARVVAGLRDAEQHHVIVADEADVVHQLHMAGFFALEPEFVARTAEIDGAAELNGFLQRLAVHPSEHQHVFAALLLRDDGHQALRVPFDVIKPIHRAMLRGSPGVLQIICCRQDRFDIEGGFSKLLELLDVALFEVEDAELEKRLFVHLVRLL